MSETKTEVLERTEDFANSFVGTVYYWMCSALIISGALAYFCSQSAAVMSFLLEPGWLFFGLVIADFVLVLVLSAVIDKLSFVVALVMFLLYSALNGVVLSTLFLVYELGSIMQVFAITVGMFGGMAVYGSITDRDLSGMGEAFYMAIWGLILAGIVHVFFQNSMFELLMSIVGVVIFAGITAYDSQQLKAFGMQANMEDDSTQKYALLGALTLYLDFINLFIYLLRLFGKKK